MRPSAERTARRAERTAALQQERERERDEELSRRARCAAIARQRRAWERGAPRGLADRIELHRPDGVPVRIAVERVGRGRPVQRRRPRAARGGPGAGATR
ncbi:hypothetical protein ACFW1A_09240 [Kitasatospora sp. NPDC058965]|uniref:hypothetical protein n=1 Tax=Kitasatospora sp. NPDC058965 TaxID=3346682 RepID=UPI0036B46CB4